jgi:radical SAM superfamily enzyme YgiQ (UPF0313 family)
MKVCLVLHKYNIPLDEPCVYPLGFMYISSVLKQHGHKVKILNFNLWEYNFEEEVKDQDCVLFTGFEGFKLDIIRDASICAKYKIHTILGGGLATFSPAEMLLYVNTVVVGEGENIIETVLNHSGIIAGTKVDLNTLPLPDYTGFGIEEYNKHHSINYMGVLTARGCPYSCTFCAQTCNYQERDLQLVFDEIDYYEYFYGIELLSINDNTLNIRRDRYLKICEELKIRDLNWMGAIRVDKFDEEMAIATKQSGCKYLVVGIESFNQDRLDFMRKETTVKDIHKTLDLLHKYEIDYHGNVLVGFEDETYSDIMIELQSIPSEYKVFPCFVYPFAGTKNGKTRKISVDEYNHLYERFKLNIYSNNKIQLSEQGA